MSDAQLSNHEDAYGRARRWLDLHAAMGGGPSAEATQIMLDLMEVYTPHRDNEHLLADITILERECEFLRAQRDQMSTAITVLREDLMRRGDALLALRDLVQDGEVRRIVDEALDGAEGS